MTDTRAATLAAGAVAERGDTLLWRHESRAGSPTGWRAAPAGTPPRGTERAAIPFPATPNALRVALGSKEAGSATARALCRSSACASEEPASCSRAQPA